MLQYYRKKGTKLRGLRSFDARIFQQGDMFVYVSVILGQINAVKILNEAQAKQAVEYLKTL